MNSETENPSLSLCVNDQQTEQPDYNRDTYMASGGTYDVPHTYTATEVQIAGITGSDRFTVTYAESASATLSVDSAWNTIKNVLAESTGAASVTLHNVVNTDVILGNGGNSHVSIDGAKRGDITTGDGNDSIAITAFSNAGSGNDFNLSTGAGDDSVAITGAAHTIANLSTGSGADNVRLSGGFTQVNIAAGDGDDVIDLAAASFDKAVINGGLGDDTIVVGVGRSAIDTLAGGAGLDTIEVRLAASEYTASVLQDLIMLKQFMADPANTGKTCLVSSLGIRVGDAETLRLFVDGQPVMVDNPPTVSAVSGGTAAESTTDAATLVSGAIVAADLDGDALTYTVLTDDVLHHGTLAVAADGSFVFTAQNGDWNGTDRFTVRIADGQGGFIDQAVAITITPTQDGPVVGNSDATGTEDTILTGKVTATDPDGDRLHYSFGIDAAGNVVTRLDTAHGTAIIDPNTGVYRFIPQHDWSGSDSFAVQVSDGTSEIETPVTVVIAKQGVATNLHFRVNDQQTWTPDYTSGNFVVSDVSSFATSDVFTADQMHIDGITTGESLAVSFDDADSGTIRVLSGWNTIKSVLAESDHNATVRFENAVNTDVSLGEGGDSQVTIVAAKRGDIVTASGDDTVTITAESNDNGWDNTFNISTDDGNDTVTVTGDTWTDTSIDTGAGADSVRLAGTFDDIVLKGGDGADTLDIAAASFDFATIDSGAGDDVVTIGQGQGTPDRADGGVGTDTLVVSLGAAEFTAQVQAELLSFQRFAAAPANQGLVFTFATLGGLQAKNFERIQLLVDGQPVPVVNHAPETGTQAFVTSEDAPLNGLLTAIDPDGDAVSFSLLSGDGVTLNADGSFSFDPRGRFDALKPGQSQEVDFTYRVADSFGGSTEATAIITVTGLNDAPTPQADQTVTLRNSARTILAADLMKNDTDPEGDTLSLVAVGNASHGTVQLDTVSGEITFIPEEGFVGDATFDYTVSDEHGGFATATTTVKVVTSYGNSAPVAIDDFLLGTCGDDILVGGSGNDTLIGGGGSDTLTGGGGDDTLIVNGDDMVSGGSGQDTVIVVGDTGVSIDLGLSEVETVYGSTGDDTLDASGTTGAAVIGGGGDDSIIGGSGGGTFSGGAGNDTFIVGGGDTSFDGGEGNDTAVFGSNGHAGGIGDYNVRHASDGGWVFTAPDGSSTTIRNTDTVVFEDMEVIFEPVRRCAGAFRIWEDVPVTIPKALLLTNDYDADGDPLTIASVDNGPYGQVSLDADGNVRFVGSPDFNGTTTFAYTISDGHGGFDSATVTIYVRPVNDTPTAQDVAITTVEDMPVIGRLVAADVDGDSLVWSLQDNAQHGTVTLAADGSYTYAPTADWNGTDNFRVRVADGVGGMVDQTVTVEVAAVNDRPVAVNDSGFHSTAGQPITFTAGDLLANDSDVEGDLLSIVSVGDAVGGTVLRNSDGTITFTPDEWSEGQVGFRYTVSDPFGATDDAVVTVNLLPPTYSRYLAEGADTIVNLTESGAQEHPQVAVLAGGGHVVVWQSAGQDGSGYGVYARVHGANGV
ncbi:Ig-like domain-containing protein, partial [Magnetospirillum aberrantis]